jgi:hypothetical protein
VPKLAREWTMKRKLEASLESSQRSARRRVQFETLAYIERPTLAASGANSRRKGDPPPPGSIFGRTKLRDLLESTKRAEKEAKTKLSEAEKSETRDERRDGDASDKRRAESPGDDLVPPSTGQGLNFAPGGRFPRKKRF